MVVRQIIRNGGFDPEDVARLDAAFTAAWNQIEFRFDSRVTWNATRSVRSWRLLSWSLASPFTRWTPSNCKPERSRCSTLRFAGLHLRQRVATSGVVCQQPQPKTELRTLTLGDLTFHFAGDPAAV